MNVLRAVAAHALAGQLSGENRGGADRNLAARRGNTAEAAFAPCVAPYLRNVRMNALFVQTSRSREAQVGVDTADKTCMAARPTNAERVASALVGADWVVMVVTYVSFPFIELKSSSLAQSLLTPALTIFFLTLLASMVAAMVAQPKRRRTLGLLTASVALWAAGSVNLNATAVPDLTRFPAPGEWLFLASYVAMAAFLIFDSARRLTMTLSAWLETIVICGGTACLAGALLLSPVSHDFARGGVALLLALLYPLIDVSLALLVIAQIMLRARGGIRQSGPLVLAFGVFAYADAHFVTNLSTGVYGSSLINDGCWGLAFTLLVTHACRRPPEVVDAVPRRQGSVLVVGAGFAALAVLALPSPDGVGQGLIAVALITLIAVGGRLVVALREANRATEAFALARSDDLTHLPNRRAVLALTAERLESNLPLALMILDLNGFKDVNDTLGHAAGDAVLRLIAFRMREVLSPDIMVARLGGDEFATVIPNDDEIAVMNTAQEILRVVRQPLTIEGISMAIDASIGVTVSSSLDSKSTELLRRADVAMYKAKLTRCGALLYDPYYDHFSREKLQIAEELRKGIAAGQLLLWYQPQIAAGTQRICGLEALVRWQHPTEGLLTPADFLPAARRAGLMPALSEEVARIAMADLAGWRSRGLEPRVAINCAPPELMSGLFLKALYKQMHETNVPPESIVIELTEDSFISEPERAREILQDIRRHEVQISIDDYGTGFSSLSYLRDLPVQELKIDRSFITDMNNDPRSRMIVASTVQMAKALGLRTVAEGIEDAATAAALVALGVDVLQGYHLARPIAPEQVEAWIWQWASYSDFGYEPSAGDVGTATE
jgi:diguanylate cyclase (GGDEF)-like protein